MLITCPHCNRMSEQTSELRVGEVVLDLEGNWARRGATSVRLSPIEAAILAALMRGGDAGVTRVELERIVYQGFTRSNTALPMGICRVREKIARLRADVPKRIGGAQSEAYRLVVTP